MSTAPSKIGLQIPATLSLKNSYLLLTSLLLVNVCLQQAKNGTIHSFIHCFFYLLMESLIWARQGTNAVDVNMNRARAPSLRSSEQEEDKQKSTRDLYPCTIGINRPQKKKSING